MAEEIRVNHQLREKGSEYLLLSWRVSNTSQVVCWNLTNQTSSLANFTSCTWKTRCAKPITLIMRLHSSRKWRPNRRFGIQLHHVIFKDTNQSLENKFTQQKAKGQSELFIGFSFGKGFPCALMSPPVDTVRFSILFSYPWMRSKDEWSLECWWNPQTCATNLLYHRIQKVYCGILVLECTDEETSSFPK